MKKHLVFWIVFPLCSLLLLAIILFYMDLTNGPIVFFVLELVSFLGFVVASILLINKRKLIRLIPIGAMLGLTIIFFSLSHPVKELKRAVSNSNPEETEVLSLKNGDIKGLYTKDKSVEVYAGIPYATPPVGDLRWKEPKPVSNWEGVLDCTRFAPVAMQAEENFVMNTLVDIYAEGGWHPDYNSYPDEFMSEDCLYLNIWKPKNAQGKLPILFFIHGGSLTGGSSAYQDYNGETMAKEGVIMITIAYRLGVFGYYAHPSLKEESLNGTTGNYGLLDQIQALKWVNENADYFGGDKDNITIAGESAGSSSISALCVSPLAKGLFKRAIGESSSIVGKYPPHTFRSYQDAIDMGKDIMEEMNCKSIEELRKLPAEKLMQTKYTNSSMTIDGYAIPKSPNEIYLLHENNEEALLNGYNVKEADAFVIPTMLFDLPNKNNIKSKLSLYFDETLAEEMIELYKDEIENDAFTVFNQIISAYWFFMPHYEWSTLAYNNGETVYRYQFTRENGYYGTYHAGEMIYAYGNIGKSTHGFAYQVYDTYLSSKMVKYWSNFVKYGNPNGMGEDTKDSLGESLENWNEWTPSGNNLLELGTKVQEINEKYIAAYEIIERWNERVNAN